MSSASDFRKSPVDGEASTIAGYLRSQDHRPLFVQGDAAAVLAGVPDSCVDCAMTSPPYWGQRSYAGGGIGLEETWQHYIDHLLAVFHQLKRVLKPIGSFWLNIGDAYERKNLLGLPWRVALAMTDRDGWVLRNSVIWNKVKGGPDNAKDKLRNVHENLFHFVSPSASTFPPSTLSTPRKDRSEAATEHIVERRGCQCCRASSCYNRGRGHGRRWQVGLSRGVVLARIG